MTIGRWLKQDIKLVMPGLVPGIHDFARRGKEDVDGRVKPAMTNRE
jgi:hypothetical protein